jgi:hypothetical protein
MIKKILLVAAVVSLVQFTQAQNSGQAKEKKMLMGKWIANEDPIFTLQVFSDHIIQFNKGEDDSDYFTYEVTPVPCDTTVPQRSKTGFYLNETGGDGLTTCSYIELLNEDSLLINYNWGAKLLHFGRKKASSPEPKHSKQ